MQRLHDVYGSGEGHAQATSTGVADIQTLTAPKDAKAVLLNCATTDARFTLDGSAPASGNGLLLKKDQNPVYIPVGKDIKFAAAAAAASIVDALWLK